MARFLRPFSRQSSGRITVRLRSQEREYLRALSVGFFEHLSSDDPALERLTPTVYADPDLETEYQSLAGTDLTASREGAIREVLRTIGDKSLSPETAELWMRAFNDLRLVLGTQIGVTEEWRDDLEPDDPRAQSYFLYRFLTEVVGCLVWALYEQGNREPGFVLPTDTTEFDDFQQLDDEVEDDDDDEDDEDDDDDYDYGDDQEDYGGDDDEDDDEDDDHDDDDIELLVDRLRDVENISDLESLTGIGGLDRFDPPQDPPHPSTDPSPT